MCCTQGTSLIRVRDNTPAASARQAPLLVGAAVAGPIDDLRAVDGALAVGVHAPAQAPEVDRDVPPPVRGQGGPRTDHREPGDGSDRCGDAAATPSTDSWVH